MDIRLERMLPGRFSVPAGGSGLWDCSLEFPPGALVQITAPSARGKSTFISMLYGLDFDYTGSLQIGSRELKSCSAVMWAQLRQKQLSIVFQELRLLEDFSGLDNILVKARLTGTTTEEEIEQMAGALHIQDALQKKAGEMSWGEKQRIALLRALVQPFSWLLLDEPFSHLDSANTAACVQLICRACEERGAGLVVTSLDRDALFSYGKVVEL